MVTFQVLLTHIFLQKSNRYNLRSLAKNPYRKQCFKTEAYKRWLINHGLTVWDELDENIKTLPFQSFKHELKNKLLDAYF